jgi:hypothetical protein
MAQFEFVLKGHDFSRAANHRKKDSPGGAGALAREM